MQALSGGDRHGGNDLRHHMAGRDKVDVVAALRLQAEHHLGQFIWFDLTADAFLADLPVLAEGTAQAAPGKKEGARAVRPTQRIFFTMVSTIAVDHGVCTSAAHGPPGSLKTVDITIACAQITVGHVFIGLPGPHLQLVILQQGEVGRFKLLDTIAHLTNVFLYSDKLDHL